MRFALGMLWSCAFLSARAGNLSVEFLHSGHAADIVEQWQCQQPHSLIAGHSRHAGQQGEADTSSHLPMQEFGACARQFFAMSGHCDVSPTQRVCNSRHFCTKSFCSCSFCLLPECDWKYLNCVWMRNSNKSLQTFFLQRVPAVPLSLLSSFLTVLDVYRGIHSAILSTFGPRIN